MSDGSGSMPSVAEDHATPAPSLTTAIRYRRWLSFPAFWLAWWFATAALLSRVSTNPPWVPVAFGVGALGLVLLAVVHLLHPFTAVRLTTDGLGFGRRLHRWSDIESLELRGSCSRPSLCIRSQRRRTGSTVAQRSVVESLATVAQQASEAHGVRLVDLRRPSALRQVLVTAGVVVVVLLAAAGATSFVVPGVWVTRPGAVVDAHDRLRGERISRGSGEILILSVHDQPSSVGDLLLHRGGGTEFALYNPLRRRSDNADPVNETSAREAAVAAGLQCGGQTVSVYGRGVEVGTVNPSGPAAGLVGRHEQIVSVAGTEVSAKEDVYAALVDWNAPDPAPVVLADANGSRRTEQLPTYRASDGTVVLHGVEVLRRRIKLVAPTDRPSFDLDDLTGDSSGLAIAVTVVDASRQVPLVAAGSRVAMTGSMAPSGLVGPVGGIPHNVAAARRAGASVMLVPASEAAHARSLAGPGLPVVGVRTLTDAVVALGGSPC